MKRTVIVMIKVMEARRNLYRFLSQMYLMEIDKEMMHQLKDMVFPKDTGNEYLDEGYEMFAKGIEELADEDLDTLSSDYAKTFLAAGDAQGNAAFPYESVYTSKRRLVGQESRVSAAEAYAQYGLKLGKPIFKIPEDHISVEFEFMAYLCEKWMGSDSEKADIETAQKKFFNEHIKNWVIMFCTDAERDADTGFYKGLAKITRGFVQAEKDLMSRI